MMHRSLLYRCPHRACQQPLRDHSDRLECSAGHVFLFVGDTAIPVFASAPDDATEYATQNAVKVHDNALRWVFDTFGGDEATLRRKLIARLGLQPGQTVLLTGAGTGNDLPFLAESLQRGTIYAQDFARQMLSIGVERFGPNLAEGNVEVHFSVSDATNLPLPDGVFDAAYHFGGINLFSSVSGGIAEMNRVVRRGGRVVFCDEGIAPWLRETEYGRILIRNNGLYAFEPPIHHVPVTATDVGLSWEVGNCFYVIEFTVGTSLPPVNIDVPHVGVRGGSVRKRYFGQLEGIDPAIRDRVYAEARERGLSRVDYLEALLIAGSDATTGKQE